jgi:hypothetical protein
MLPNAVAVLSALHDALNDAGLPGADWMRTLSVTQADTTWRFTRRVGGMYTTVRLPADAGDLTGAEVEQALAVLVALDGRDPLRLRRAVLPHHVEWDCPACEGALALEVSAVGMVIANCPGCDHACRAWADEP